MSEYATKVVATAGPIIAQELAGLMMSRALAEDDDGQREIAERLASELMEEVERVAHTREREEIAADDPAYIADVWEERPTYHRALEQDGGRSWRTSCGRSLSWKAISVMLPFRAAGMIGDPCANCYTGE